MVGKGPESINEHEVGTPRNAKQVANFQAAERRRLMLSSDDLYNLYYMAHMQKFIKKIDTFPNVKCIMYIDHLVTNAKLKLDKLKIMGKQEVAAYVKDPFSLFEKKLIKIICWH